MRGKKCVLSGSSCKKAIGGEFMKKFLGVILFAAICFVLFLIPSQMVSAITSTPIYRFYSPRTQEHFFTYNPAERDQLLNRGWGNYEGVSWYAPCNGDDVYRLYNPVSDDHFYTRNWSEYFTLSTHRGWIPESVAFYSDTGQRIPVYRLYNPSLQTGSHHYTTSIHEVNVLTSQRGWHYEGIAWYASSLTGQTTDEIKTLGVQFINQETAGAPMGCEAASALEALHYKGHAGEYNLSSFLKTMPIAVNGNPYEGFGGTPYTVVTGIYQSIFPSAFVPWITRFGSAKDISGSNLNVILSQVAANNPVVTWVTLDYQRPRWNQYDWGKGIDNTHVVTVDGYSNSAVHVVDPENGAYWVSKSKFSEAYEHMKFAVVIQ